MGAGVSSSAHGRGGVAERPPRALSNNAIPTTPRRQLFLLPSHSTPQRDSDSTRSFTPLPPKPRTSSAPPLLHPSTRRMYNNQHPNPHMHMHHPARPPLVPRLGGVALLRAAPAQEQQQQQQRNYNRLPLQHTTAASSSKLPTKSDRNDTKHEQLGRVPVRCNASNNSNSSSSKNEDDECDAANLRQRQTPSITSRDRRKCCERGGVRMGSEDESSTSSVHQKNNNGTTVGDGYDIYAKRVDWSVALETNQRSRRAAEAGVVDTMYAFTRRLDPVSMSIIQRVSECDSSARAMSRIHVDDNNNDDDDGGGGKANANMSSHRSRVRLARELRVLEDCERLIRTAPPHRMEELGIIVHCKAGELCKQGGEVERAKQHYATVIQLAEQRVARQEKDIYMVLKRYVVAMVGLSQLWYEQEKQSGSFRFVHETRPPVSPAVPAPRDMPMPVRKPVDAAQTEQRNRERESEEAGNRACQLCALTKAALQQHSASRTATNVAAATASVASLDSLESSLDSDGGASVFSITEAILRRMEPRMQRRYAEPHFQRIRLAAPRCFVPSCYDGASSCVSVNTNGHTAAGKDCSNNYYYTNNTNSNAGDGGNDGVHYGVAQADVNRLRREDAFVLYSKFRRALIASPCELLLLRCLEVVEIGHSCQSELMLPPLVALAQIYEDLELYSRALLLVRRCVGNLCAVFDYDHPWVVQLTARVRHLQELLLQQTRQRAATKIQATWKMCVAMRGLERAVQHAVRRHTRVMPGAGLPGLTQNFLMNYIHHDMILPCSNNNSNSTITEDYGDTNTDSTIDKAQQRPEDVARPLHNGSAGAKMCQLSYLHEPPSSLPHFAESAETSRTQDKMTSKLGGSSGNAERVRSRTNTSTNHCAQAVRAPATSSSYAGHEKSRRWSTSGATDDVTDRDRVLSATEQERHQCNEKHGAGRLGPRVPPYSSEGEEECADNLSVSASGSGDETVLSGSSSTSGENVTLPRTPQRAPAAPTMSKNTKSSTTTTMAKESETSSRSTRDEDERAPCALPSGGGVALCHDAAHTQLAARQGQASIHPEDSLAEVVHQRRYRSREEAGALASAAYDAHPYASHAQQRQPRRERMLSMEAHAQLFDDAVAAQRIGGVYSPGRSIHPLGSIVAQRPTSPKALLMAQNGTYRSGKATVPNMNTAVVSMPGAHSYSRSSSSSSRSIQKIDGHKARPTRARGGYSYPVAGPASLTMLPRITTLGAKATRAAKQTDDCHSHHARTDSPYTLAKTRKTTTDTRTIARADETSSKQKGAKKSRSSLQHTGTQTEYCTPGNITQQMTQGNYDDANEKYGEEYNELDVYPRQQL